MAKAALGGLLEGGRGVGVAAARLEQGQRQRTRASTTLAPPVTGSASAARASCSAPAQSPWSSRTRARCPSTCWAYAGQIVRLDEGQRPVQVLAGVAVVPHLRADGGQVDQRPGGVVLQPGADRHLERLLQVGPAARVAGLEPGRADVGQGVGEGLLVVQPPGQLDRPPGPAIAASVRWASMSSWAWLL